MKTIAELLNQQPVFLNEFKNKEDVGSEFAEENYDIPRNERVIEGFYKCNVLFASYGTGNYSGDAFVLFEQDGKLYEVNGSHCSCNGLEGQWYPEETSVEALVSRLTDGSFGTDDWCGNEFATELKEFLIK